VHYPGGNVFTLRDPYAFMPTLGSFDEHLFGEGRHWRLYEKLGAHGRNLGGVSGVSFAVWAPQAEGVSVVGDFNNWDGRLHQMRRLGVSGVWEIFIPDLGTGAAYKYEIHRRGALPFLKRAARSPAPPLEHLRSPSRLLASRRRGRRTSFDLSRDRARARRLLP
jgi:1,4-alpha-glucan branching enzyme